MFSQQKRVQLIWAFGVLVLALVLSGGAARAVQVPGRTDDPSSAAQPARITVRVPADAVVWFDGVPTRQSGPWRRLVTPPLEPGRKYRYEVRARWGEGGQAVERQRRLSFRAGDNLTVDFLPPTRPGERRLSDLSGVPPRRFERRYNFSQRTRDRVESLPNLFEDTSDPFDPDRWGASYYPLWRR
jgi:uncharacterized protein (TIGR03000 family)